MDVKLARTDSDILSCWQVMAELRPHLRQEEFLDRVRSQMRAGFLMAFVEKDQQVLGVAGYRFLTNLAWGKFLYIDDLVTTSPQRSIGVGRALLQWLCQEARAAGCQRVELDSGVQRFQAHRFYLREGMIISSHHFSLPL